MRKKILALGAASSIALGGGYVALQQDAAKGTSTFTKTAADVSQGTNLYLNGRPILRVTCVDRGMDVRCDVRY